MSQFNQTDAQMFDEIERHSWHESLMEKTRDAFLGLSDDEIRAFLRDTLKININAIVSYCMSHADDCFGLSYVDVARVSGIHDSEALRFSAGCVGSPVADMEHVDVSASAEAASQETHKDNNLVFEVNQDRNYSTYCQSLNIDPDDKSSVRGYVFSNSLATRVLFFFVGGAFVFPLVLFYMKFVGAIYLPSLSGGLAEASLSLHDSVYCAGSNSKDFAIYALAFTMFQAVVVILKIKLRIISAFISSVITQIGNVGIVFRGGH